MDSILHFLLYALGVALVALVVGLVRKHDMKKKSGNGVESEKKRKIDK